MQLLTRIYKLRSAPECTLYTLGRSGVTSFGELYCTRARFFGGSDQEPGTACPKLPHVRVRRCSRRPRFNVSEALACANDSSFSDSRWC